MISLTQAQIKLLKKIRARLISFSYTYTFFTTHAINPFYTNIFKIIKAEHILKNASKTTQLTFNLFFFGISLSQNELGQLFTRDEVEVLEINGIIQRVNEDEYRSGSMIIPFQDLYLFTDFPYLYSKNKTIVAQREISADFVFTPTIESIRFLNEIKHNKRGRMLDIGTGCGIVALFASRFNKQVVGVDCNSRAVHYASFNAIFNQITNVEFRVSDGFTKIPERFDVIVSNTPHEIHYKKRNTSTFGGETGVEFMLSIIKDAQKHLSKKGRMFLETAITGKQAYTSLHKEAIKNGFHSQYKKMYSFRIEDYVMSHSMDMLLVGMSEYINETEKYLSYCETHKIKNIECGMFILSKELEK